MKSKAIENRPLSSLSEVANLSIFDFARRIEPGEVLMCEPAFFAVKDVKNPFMEGMEHSTDTASARAQWTALKETFERLGYAVHLINPQADLEDMVFTANQVLPGLDDDGKPFVLLSEMRHPSRQKEVPWFRKWFLSRGYRVITLLDGIESGEIPRFEGQGDAIWHPGRKLLWGGYGFRTDAESYEIIGRLIKVPVIKLKLVNDRFYHLDTCFCPLDSETVMIYPPAFDEDGLNLIKHFFSGVIEVSEEEANNFALNALILDRHVVMQKGSRKLIARLEERGFLPVEVETGEFMKSGGSVFCLKMMIY